MTDYLIVGNSVAAVGAIEGIVRTDPKPRIRVLSREESPAYSRPMISYLLGGRQPERKMIYRPLEWYRTLKVDLRLGVVAEGIDTKKGMASLSDGSSLAYDRLLLAVGGTPISPPIPGKELDGVTTFTRRDEAKALIDRLPSINRVVILGGGMIGLKAAEGFLWRGKEVTIVELADRVLSVVMDHQASAVVSRHLQEKGARIVTGTTIEEIRGHAGRVKDVKLKDGTIIPADLVVLAIGVVPDLTLAKGAKLAANRGITVDASLRTSVEGIWAAGDVTETYDLLTGQYRPIPIWPKAYGEGEAAGIVMAGGTAEYRGCFGMNAIEILDLPTVSIGLSAEEGEGFEYLVTSDPARKLYRRVVLRDGKIVGVTLIGTIDRAGIYSWLIAEGIPVDGVKKDLAREDFGFIHLPKELRTGRLGR